MSIEWKDVYKIGDAEIDAQHEELFSKINRFLLANDKASQTASAMSLYQHTREHFKHEEDLMRRVKFPSIAPHVEQHNDLISRLNDVSLAIANGTLNKADLEAFLADWTKNHIRIFDTRLASFLRQHTSQDHGLN
jgi:hemerythrin